MLGFSAAPNFNDEGCQRTRTLHSQPAMTKSETRWCARMNVFNLLRLCNLLVSPGNAGESIGNGVVVRL